MRLLHRVLWLPLLTAASALCVACGGAPAAPAAPAAQTSSADAPAAALAGSPAARCLAASEAPRPRRADEPAKITAKHILVRHADAQSPDGATRTREEACLRAAEARDKARGGADFDALVGEYSDEPGAASRAGSVGAIERTDVLPSFADAAFELDLNQLSDVVETKYGFHLILRTE